MTDADRVLELFAEINPVTDQPRHEMEVKAGMSDVTIKHPETQPETPAPNPYRRLVLVAAALVAVVAGAVLFQTRPADVADGSADALTVFEGALADFEADDVDAFMAAFSADARLFTLSRANDPDAIADMQWFYALLERSSDLTCSADGASVRCEGTVDNVLTTAAGLGDGEVVLTGTVADGEITRVAYSGPDINGFVDLVVTWIATTQPGVWAERFTECFSEINCFRTDAISFLMNAESAQAILDRASATDDESVAVAEEFFSQLDDGNDGVALAMAAPGVAGSDNWGDIDLAAETALNVGQGTEYVDLSCGVLAVATDNSLVLCEYGTADALAQAVDGPAVPSLAGVAVTDGEITGVTFRYREPDFTNARRPFERWMGAEHPEVTCLAGYLGECEDPTTPDGWRDTGTQVASYAEEWAAWLRTNGCTASEQGRGFGVCAG